MFFSMSICMVVRFTACSLFFCVRRFFSPLDVLFGVVWFHDRVPPGPDTPGCSVFVVVVGVVLTFTHRYNAVRGHRILLYDVFYTWHVFIHTECCCRCCCCLLLCVAIPVLLLPQLLLLLILCRMTKTVAGSSNLIPSSVFFPFIPTRLIFNVCIPLGCTVAFTASICLYITSAVITGMRGAKAGVSPPRHSPPCMYICILRSI